MSFIFFYVALAVITFELARTGFALFYSLISKFCWLLGLLRPPSGANVFEWRILRFFWCNTGDLLLRLSDSKLAALTR